MSKKSPSQLIDERTQKMDEMGMYGPDVTMPKKSYCMDTGQPFMCYGEEGMYSPYTGSMNVESDYSDEAVPSYEEEGYMKPTGIPGSQSNMSKQVPLSPNPAGSATIAWSTTQASPNPAPDAQGQIGATQAGPKGFVPYPQSSAPGHVTKKPGEKT